MKRTIENMSPVAGHLSPMPSSAGEMQTERSRKSFSHYPDFRVYYIGS